MNKLEIIVNAIKEKKGQDVVIVDFEGKNSLADYAVICTGSSNRNVKAISENVEAKIKENLTEDKLSSEGLLECEWILLDFGSVLVNIFDEKTRQHYRLEELWVESKITRA